MTRRRIVLGVLTTIAFVCALVLVVADALTLEDHEAPAEACLEARISVQDAITALEDPTEHRAVFAQRGRRLLTRVEPCVNTWLPIVQQHVRAVDRWNLEAYRDEDYGFRELAARLRALLDDLPAPEHP